MYLEQKLRSAQMQKGERVYPFLMKLQETRDELSVMGHTPQDSELVRLTLNSISDEWQVFVQSILDRATLPNWDEIWAALKQEKLRRDLVKVKLDESNNSSGSKPKVEERYFTHHASIILEVKVHPISPPPGFALPHDHRRHNLLSQLWLPLLDCRHDHVAHTSSR